MTVENDSSWTDLSPPLRNKTSREAFLVHARGISKLLKGEDHEDAAEQRRNAFCESARASGLSDQQVLLAAGLVVSDLANQGWQVRARCGRVEVRPPVPLSNDRAGEKARIRQQELVKRNAQLRQTAVRQFLRAMESTQLFNGKFTSIFSLMRDGRELAEGLRGTREYDKTGWADALSAIIDPYLEFVSSNEATCAFTGLRLMDIWRYFRHTWTNQYTSVPGRTMMFLVRDRAAPFHPVMGIGALSSPVIQIRERDTWIGWHPDVFLERLKANPTPSLARWLVKVVDAAIGEIYVDDLVEDDVISMRDLSDPSDAAIDQLLKDSADQRRLHYRYFSSKDHKSKRPEITGDDYWSARARTHLFRSKRGFALASYLRARAVLKDAFSGRPTAETLAALARTSRGSDAIRKIVKKAKADRVGIAVADISVCGAVQPYNAILGGKLVAMLATSPEVVLEYKRRYAGAESEIASAMAGRAIVRTPMLVLLGTTSLYGVGSSQYNRVKIPCDRLGGLSEDVIHYEELGHSETFGTSQYSDETVEALVDLVQQSEDGRPVNSVFGEGVSPKLRKVRQGLDLLRFPSELLLRHHRPRIVYAVPLIRNLREHLLGFEPKPNYLVPIDDGPAATARITAWWKERWLRTRIVSDEVLADVARHSLVLPIRHGGRVTPPQTSDPQLSFAELG